MDKQSDMAILVAVVEAGGFSPAARALNLTHSAISKRIQRLEQRLGVQLLTRTTRFMQLTEVGRVYVREARVILDKIQALEQAVCADAEVPRGDIKISAPSVFGRHVVTPALIGFLDRYPEIKIDLMLTDELVDLKQQGVDVAIRIGRLPEAGISWIELGSSPRTLCASPAYLEVHGRPALHADLAEHIRLKLNFDTEMNPLLKRTESAQPAQTASRFTGNSVDAMYAACLAGYGIALLPNYLVAQDIANGRLISLFPTTTEEFVPSIYAIANARERLPVKLKALLDYLAQVVTGQRHKINYP